MEVVDFEVDEEHTGRGPQATTAATSAAAASEGVSSEHAPVSGRGKRNGKIRTKGRGHDSEDADTDRYDGRGGTYETLDGGDSEGPVKCT
jgi:hypothetical protein